MADQRQLQLVLKLQDEASKELKRIAGDLGGIERSSTSASGGFLVFARNIGLAAAAYKTFSAAFQGLSLGVKVAADLQTAEVGLKTLLGSAEEAASTVARLKEEAKRTPFELPGLTQATQLLSAVTKDGDESIDILLDVGEALAAMGKGQSELDRIIVNLQQVASLGHAATIDIKQFAFAGIPIYEMLSEATGLYGEELANLIENGGVTFDLLVQMFDQANDAGGRFFNAFVNQSGTFNQSLSNLKDSWGILMSDIAKETGLFDGLVRLMQNLTSKFEDYKDTIIEVINKVKEINEKFKILETIVNIVKFAFNIFKGNLEVLVSVFNSNVKPAFERLGAAIERNRELFIFISNVIKVIFMAALLAARGAIAFVVATLGALIDTIALVINFIGDMIRALEAVGKALGWVADKLLGFIGLSREATGQTQNLANTASSSYMSVAAAGDLLVGPMSVYTASTEDATTSTLNLGNQSKSSFDKMTGGAGEAADSAKKLAEEYDNVLKKITELNEQLEEVYAEKARSERGIREEFATAYVDQEEKVAELKKELEEKKAEFAREAAQSESADRINSLQEQYNAVKANYERENQVLQEHRNILDVYEQEIENTRAWNALTDFERTIQTINLKMISEGEALKVKIQNIQKEIAEEEKKAQAIIAKQGNIKTVTVALSNAATNTVVSNFNAEASAAEQAASRIIRARQSAFIGPMSYNAPMSVMPNMSSVNDAIIDPSGRIITTAPDDYLIATKDPQSLGKNSGVTVNVTVNGDVSGRELVEMVEEALMSKLRNNVRLSL